MQLKQYIDSTYLKTNEQAGLSDDDNNSIVVGFIQEAIDEGFKLVMIRPNKVAMARQLMASSNSKVLVGTVISFPEGTNSIEQKIAEAHKAIEDGVDEIDFVCNYQAFKAGNIELVKNEIYQGTKLALDNNKVAKWIIEVVALTADQIIKLSALIKNVVITNFKEENYANVFVKSSTGFYKTEDNRPNGVTLDAIILMLENSAPLPVKAAGGVKTYSEAIDMIRLGVKRIGTSGAKTIVDGQIASGSY